MASPVDTFKNSLFGQLKSYSNAVQGAFEQRIARPLLAFKRDLSRPTSEARAPNDQDIISAQHTRQESTSSSSPSPLEIIDVNTSGSFKSIFDKVKNTLSPATKRRTSENTNNNENQNSHLNSSITSSPNKNSRKSRLQHHKSVSFAENVENDNDTDSINQYSINDQNEIVRNAQTLADQILIAGIDEATAKTRSMDILPDNNNDDDDNGEFQREFNLTIKPRRITSDNKEDLVYQDLSAEIVAYVLKHAIRTLKKEQQQQQQQQQLIITDNNEQNEDFIDLK